MEPMINHPPCIPDDLAGRTKLSHWLRVATFPARCDVWEELGGTVEHVEGRLE
jgi:hypothetical protein